MSKLAHLEPVPAQARYFEAGEVLGAAQNGRYPVQLAGDGVSEGAWARTAVSAPLHLGDEVLVAGDSIDRLFIIGILTRGQEVPERTVRIDGGACARVEEHDGRECLRVFSERDEPLFEYDPASSKAKVMKPPGDLEFEAADGDIYLKSAGAIRLESREIDLASSGAIRLTVADELRRLASSLWLGLGSLGATSGEVWFQAKRARLAVEETRVTGARLLSRFRYVRVVADKSETIASTVVERSKNAYRSVEQLCQTNAARLRTLVGDTYQMTVGKAFLKAREDFKVKAEKIHLG